MDVEQMGDGATQEKRAVDTGDEAAAAKLWAVYISEAEKYDKGLVESWKSDMQGMLIFVSTFFSLSSSPFSELLLHEAGLFSASLTAFLIESYKTLNVDSGDATVQLLARISQQLEGSANGSTLPIPSSSAFTPTTASVVCNALCRIMTIIAALILLVVVVTYSVLTLLPLQYFDCPYRTPLSGGVWRLFRSYKWIWAQSTSKSTLSDETMVETMAHRAVEDSAERTIRDGRALVWTVKSLADDSELEPFVEGIPEVLWKLSAPGYPVPVFLGSGGPRYGQRYSYADHIRELVNNPEVRLCDRIESHLQSCDTGLLSAEVRKRRLIASYKALWAIATLFHPKQFPMQPLLDFSRWKRFFKMEEDSDILPYSVSAQALLRWNSVSAVEPRSLELLDYLAKCRIDIEQGREPDKQPLILILKEVFLENNYYVQRVNHSNLTVELISEIETEINEIRCNTRFNYLERAAGLDSEP
ncbi:hypothetical protein MVEN_01864200 [Mycena venus]|uniref:DUF6535 domain-containing protein n=1 Tax=Mycena venus TaxID=2733690 RepID=A0A8H6XIT3_9AGAR|nr:hypothetical protein MVEN_01864200 [Mycena venus]